MRKELQITEQGRHSFIVSITSLFEMPVPIAHGHDRASAADAARTALQGALNVLDAEVPDPNQTQIPQRFTYEYWRFTGAPVLFSVFMAYPFTWCVIALALGALIGSAVTQ